MTDVIRPTVIVDEQEKRPWAISKFPTERRSLRDGDYTIKGFGDVRAGEPALFVVERKSLDDLAGTLGKGRKRFDREVERLRRYEFAAIVIEGTEEQVLRGEYGCGTRPQSIIEALRSYMINDGIHVVWAYNARYAGEWFEESARHWVDRLFKNLNRMDPRFARRKFDEKAGGWRVPVMKKPRSSTKDTKGHDGDE